MKILERQPCKTCPYRQDTPVGIWHPAEFAKLAASDRHDFSPLYACHKYGKAEASDRSMCAGWLLDQMRRNVPSLMLRIKLLDGVLAEQAVAVTDGGHDLYPSIADMCRANGVDVEARR